MFNPSEDQKLTYAPLKELTDRHKIIAQMECRGKRNHEIAQQLGMSEGNICKVKADALYVAYKMDLDRDLRDAMAPDIAGYVQSLGMKTVKKIEQIMDQGDFKVALPAAKELLDRQLPKITRTENQNTTTINIESDTMMEAMKYMRQASGLHDDDLKDLSPEKQMELIEESILNAKEIKDDGLSSSDIPPE